MKTKILCILVITLFIGTAFSVNGCVELNDIKSNISIDKGIASSSSTADYKSFFNRHKEGESNILNKTGTGNGQKGQVERIMMLVLLSQRFQTTPL